MQRQVMPDREDDGKRTFLKPEAWKVDPKTGLDVIDEERSEEFRLFEAYGKPKVIYAVKSNKYYKDFKCEKPYFDTEVAALGLPTTAEIDEAREKLRKKAFAEKLDLSAVQIARETSPTHMDPPKEIADRLASTNYTDRLISRLNRSTLGKN